MLPPQLSKGMSSYRTRLSQPHTLVTAIATSSARPADQQIRNCSWFQKIGRQWESRQDPEYQSFSRRRSRRVRAEMENSMRRSHRWDKPGTLVLPWGTRHASHWSRSGNIWHLKDRAAAKQIPTDASEQEHDPSQGEKRWRKRMESMKGYIDQDPYRAIFGKRFDPFWSSSLWSPLIPSWMKPETESNKPAYATVETSAVTLRPSVRTTVILEQKRRGGEAFGSSSSKSARQVSTSQPTSTRYDPVSNRMVPIEAASTTPASISLASQYSTKASPPAGHGQQQTKTAPNTAASADIPVKKFGRRHKSTSTPKNDVDSLTAEDIRASMGKKSSSHEPRLEGQVKRLMALQETLCAEVMNMSRTIDQTRESLSGRVGQCSDSDHGTEDGEIAALEQSIHARLEAMALTDEALKRSLAGLEAQGFGLEGASHGGPRKPEIIQTALDRMNAKDQVANDDGYSMAPMGLQTAYNREKQACESGEHQGLARELDTQRKRFVDAQKGLVSDYTDGYGQSPMGMETSYSTEREGYTTGKTPSLEQEVRELDEKAEAGRRGLVRGHDDGYGDLPVGLQTSYSSERQAYLEGKIQSLEQEVKELEIRAAAAQKGFGERGHDDGYGDLPIGLQTSYSFEREAHLKGTALSLEQEVKDLETKSRAAQKGLVRGHDDEYGDLPVGMQTSYASEREAHQKGKIQSLEQEVRDLELKAAAALRGLIHDPDDGYEKTPMGLETSFDPADQTSFEKELKEQDKLEIENPDDVYAKTPMGLETSYDPADQTSLEEELKGHHKLEIENPDDVYAKTPMGLETAFRNEGQTSLELELKEQDKLEIENPDDAYAKTPMGLETSFNIKEQISLEQELLRKAQREQYDENDDGYAKDPSGLQMSYGAERRAAAKGQAETLEQELRAQAEGGLLPEAQDGYAKTPMGLEKSFSPQEAAALEQELKAADGLATGAQTTGTMPEYKDGYAETPTGLQTSFASEKTTCANDRIKTILEAGPGLDAKRAYTTVSSAYHDHAAQFPIGLGMLYRQPLTTNNSGRQPFPRRRPDTLKRDMAASAALQAEVDAQKGAMSAHEERYFLRASSTPSTYARQPHESKTCEPKTPKQDATILQGEGDVCANVTNFARSDRWYKRTAPNASDAAKALKAEADLVLIRNIENICTEHNLFLDSQGQQTQATGVSPRTDQVSVNLRVHDEKMGKDHYKFQPDDLEMELASQAMVAPESLSIKEVATSPLAVETAPQTAASGTMWAKPAMYKVLAYDSGNDIITAVTSPSAYSDDNGPISISHALSQLYQPARFVPHFAALQSEGFQVISATRDLLVFRKVKASENITTTTAASMSPAASVQGVAAATASSLWKSDITSTREQSAPAEIQTPSRQPINPIDGTTRPPPQETATGNFASPTGFVNYDPIFPPENIPAATTRPGTASSSSSSSPNSPAAKYAASSPLSSSSTSTQPTSKQSDQPELARPRGPRRQEPVFSGQPSSAHEQPATPSSTASTTAFSPAEQREFQRALNNFNHYSKQEQRRSQRRTRGAGDRIKWALSVGVATAVSVYAIGVGAELARGKRKEEAQSLKQMVEEVRSEAQRAEAQRRETGRLGK